MLQVAAQQSSRAVDGLRRLHRVDTELGRGRGHELHEALCAGRTDGGGIHRRLGSGDRSEHVGIDPVLGTRDLEQLRVGRGVGARQRWRARNGRCSRCGRAVRGGVSQHRREQLGDGHVAVDPEQRRDRRCRGGRRRFGQDSSNGDRCGDDLLHLDDVAAVRGHDHLPVARVDADVVHRLPEGDEVARASRVQRGHRCADLCLLAARAGDRHAEICERTLHQAGAVEAGGWIGASPHVGDAEVPLGCRHGIGPADSRRGGVRGPRRQCRKRAEHLGAEHLRVQAVGRRSVARPTAQ